MYDRDPSLPHSGAAQRRRLTRDARHRRTLRLLDELALALECEAMAWERRTRIANGVCGERRCNPAG